MECMICKVYFTDKALYRTNNTEYYQPGWMCMECIEQEKPELQQQIIQDSRKVLNELHEF